MTEHDQALTSMVEKNPLLKSRPTKTKKIQNQFTRPELMGLGTKAECFYISSIFVHALTFPGNEHMFLKFFAIFRRT